MSQEMDGGRMRFLIVTVLVVSLAGCFRVGRLPGTTNSGPHFDNPKSAILVPGDAETFIAAQKS